MADCPTRFALVSLRVGDLPEDEARRVEAHAASCPACRSKLEEIDRNAAAWGERAAADLEALLGRIEREVGASPERIGSNRIPIGRIAAAGAALAAAAVVALAFAWWAGDPDVEDGTDGVRFKGTMAVEVVAKRGDRQFRVEPGARLREGDALRFVVTTAGGGYLSVFSVDSAGRVDPFYPETDPAALPEPMLLGGPGRHELSGSVVLDDALGPESLVVVFSEAPFPRGEVHEEVRRARSSGRDPDLVHHRLGTPLEVSILEIEKVEAP